MGASLRDCLTRDLISCGGLHGPRKESPRLDHKVALITGGASGFGKAIAALFAREGARIAIADINEAAARAAAASISNTATAVRCDVSKRDDVSAAVAATLAAFGGISTAGIRPRPGLTWYNASKGAVNLLSKSMAAELAPDGIRVCCVAPVMAETPLLPTLMRGDSPDLRAQFKATVPLGRFATVEDVANATLFLASDEASFLTGNVLEVDGGRCV